MQRVYVYLWDHFDAMAEDFITQKLDKLPVFRREQCLQYRQPGDTMRCIAAFLLLEKGLREQYGITQQVSFIYNASGKPYLREYPKLFFNISHCKEGIVCALSKLEIGVDIQEPRQYAPNLSERVCNAQELRQLAETDDPARLFCALWTKKESYAKAKGIRIMEVLKKTLPEQGFWSLHNAERCLSLYHGENDADILLMHKN